MELEAEKKTAIPAQGYGIRLESIGGLGANLAGKILAEAGVLHLGLNGSQFSSYGSEKKGSPVTTYVRFAPADKSIRITEPINAPDVIAVFHEALLRDGTCVSGLACGGVLVVNTNRRPEEIWRLTGVSDVTIVCVNAQQIAIEEKTRANTAMLGALCASIGFLAPDAVKRSMADTFGKKYQELVKANVGTFDRGYREVRAEVFLEKPIESKGIAGT